jgi:integrase
VQRDPCPSRHRGRYRFQASFRQALRCTFWRLGFRQSSLRHIARIFPARRPIRLGTTTGFLACCFPREPFRGRVSHQIQRHLLSSLPATRAIQQCASWRTKGRKERITPLARPVITVLRAWLGERHGEPEQPLFPNRTGGRLSRDAIEKRLAAHVTAAVDGCPSLKAKNVTAHTLRHTAAMRLLHAGVDTSVIALWLGHEQADTTQIYLHADLKLKEKALARTTPANTKPGRYQPPDRLLVFLESL